MIGTNRGAVTLSHYNSEESYRIVRLSKLLASFAESNEGELPVSLHDHKGFLEVSWLNHPSDDQIHKIGMLWEEHDEIKDSITHLIYDQE